MISAPHMQAQWARLLLPIQSHGYKSDNETQTRTRTHTMSMSQTALALSWFDSSWSCSWSVISLTIKHRRQSTTLSQWLTVNYSRTSVWMRNSIHYLLSHHAMSHTRSLVGQHGRHACAHYCTAHTTMSGPNTDIYYIVKYRTLFLCHCSGPSSPGRGANHYLFSTTLNHDFVCHKCIPHSLGKRLLSSARCSIGSRWFFRRMRGRTRYLRARYLWRMSGWLRLCLRFAGWNR